MAARYRCGPATLRQGPSRCETRRPLRHTPTAPHAPLRRAATPPPPPLPSPLSLASLTLPLASRTSPYFPRHRWCVKRRAPPRRSRCPRTCRRRGGAAARHISIYAVYLYVQRACSGVHAVVCTARRDSSSATMHATLSPAASPHRSPRPASALTWGGAVIHGGAVMGRGSFIHLGEGLFQCDWRAPLTPVVQRTPIHRLSTHRTTCLQLPPCT